MNNLRGWSRFKALYVFFLPIRFSFLALLVLAFAMFLSDQGWDILRALAESVVSRPKQFMTLVLSSLALALAIWFWSRHLLRYRPHAKDIDDPCHDPVREPLPAEHPWATKWVPRLLGLLVFLIEIGGFWNMGSKYAKADRPQMWAIYVWLVVTAIVYFVFVTWRRRLFGLTDPKGDMFAAVKSRVAFGAITRIVLLITIALWAALFVWVLVAPVSWRLLGSMAVLILAIAVWVPIGSAIVALGEWLRFPILSVLLVWAFAISPWTDNHPIHALGRAPNRVDMKMAFTDWYDSAKKLHPAGEPVPVIVVATEGGGIRAAYWTAQVLAQLQDRFPTFKDHCFAISGVSGGALGAVEFNALLARRAENPAETKTLKQQAGDVLEFDALSGTLAALALPDFTQRFVPPAFLPDRAMALEAGWEQGWRDRIGGNLFADGFLANMQKHPELPKLFLNGTSVETGDRIITSQVNVRSALAFRNAVDAFERLGTDIPMSTAAHMSARFTYVSPAGKIPKDGDGVLEHVVDGGYFELSGAVTAAEIVAFLHEMRAEGANIQPFVIIIDHRKKKNEQDPTKTDAFCPGWGFCGPPPPDKAKRFANEVLSPPRAVLSARDARGTQALGDITQQSRDGKTGVHQLVEFRLIPRGVPLPLGWVLSREAREAIDNAVTCEGGNRTAVALVGQLLDPRAPKPVFQCKGTSVPPQPDPPAPPNCDTSNCEKGQEQVSASSPSPSGTQ